MVAAVIGDVEVARRRAECQGVAGFVQRVAEDQVVAVFLRQAAAQILPGFAAVLGAGDYQLAIHRHAILGADRRRHPGDALVFVIDRQREAETGRPAILVRNIPPLAAAVLAAEDAAMVLLPKHIGVGRGWPG